jgi:hypothetical protein
MVVRLSALYAGCTLIPAGRVKKIERNSMTKQYEAICNA